MEINLLFSHQSYCFDCLNCNSIVSMTAFISVINYDPLELLQALQEYEKHQRQTDEIQNHIPASAPTKNPEEDLEASVYPPPASCKVHRKSTIRARLGWHQSLFGVDEVIEPTVKIYSNPGPTRFNCCISINLNLILKALMNFVNLFEHEKSTKPEAKRVKLLKDIVSPRSKKAAKTELPEKLMPTTTIKELVVDVINVGSPAEWVKISVRKNIDCYEVYALIPGMLREELSTSVQNWVDEWTPVTNFLML